MKIVDKSAAQGDVLFRRIDKLPEGVKPEPRKSGEPLVVAHSETGHHHAIGEAADVIAYTAGDPLVCYLSVGGADGKYADVEHLRSFDTHETLRLPAGIWEVRKQREMAPEGWRRVAD